MKPDYVSPCGSVTLYCADALDILPKLRPGTIDAVVVDAPYSSGGMYRGDRASDTIKKYTQSGQLTTQPAFTGDNRDQRSFAYWCDLWLRLCRQASRPGAPICAFTDWRQLPITTDAIQSAGWLWRGVAVWNKGESARPQMGRFRAQSEYIVWGSNGAMPLDLSVGVLPGVFTYPIRKSEKLHQVGKPLGLMEQVVRICRPGGTVLDTFAGSASTAIGCIRTGRKFVGMEIDGFYFDVAVKRIEAELASQPAREAA